MGAQVRNRGKGMAHTTVDARLKSRRRIIKIARDFCASYMKQLERAFELIRRERDVSTAIALLIFAFATFYFSTKATHQPFDYTFRIAGALLDGKLGLTTQPPSWLNEMVPLRGEFYSVFPLGAVLVNLPLALLQKAGWLREYPAHVIAAVIAAGSVYFFFRLTPLAPSSSFRRVLLALFPIFGTWTWCNLGFAGAWQIALGFALLGETAAIYFTLVRPCPLVAGVWFALAFGNRTELVLTAPIFLLFWIGRNTDTFKLNVPALARDVAHNWRRIVLFLALPFALGLCTAAYNLARFGSVFDFGYARIPGVLKEPWYHGHVFSLSAVPWNMHKMLLAGVQDIPSFPYFQPTPFGCSIFVASPFLFLLFREGGKHRAVAWSAIGILTFVLWCHGNPGGWQFSYRYAMVLLPWMFLLILTNGPQKLSAPEVALFAVSVAINAIATYQFLWTDQIHP
jgi:hypothetical protein